MPLWAWGIVAWVVGAFPLGLALGRMIEWASREPADSMGVTVGKDDGEGS